MPPSKFPAPSSDFDQDSLVERVVEQVVEKMSKKFNDILSRLRHQLLVSIEEHRISTEGQTEMLS